MADINLKFVAAVKKMEGRTRKIGAWVIVNPNASKHHYGRVTISWSASNASASMVAWIPLEHDSNRVHKTAKGYGFSKESALMEGVQFFNLKTGQLDNIKEGKDWNFQLEDAGYVVYRAI